jgi:hypothetical protein
MFTLLNTFWGPLRGSVHHEDVIFELQMPQGEFPVYWSHYSCWHVLLAHGFKQIQETIDDPADWTLKLSNADFLWTKLSVELINRVNAQCGETTS